MRALAGILPTRHCSGTWALTGPCPHIWAGLGTECPPAPRLDPQEWHSLVVSTQILQLLSAQPGPTAAVGSGWEQCAGVTGGAGGGTQQVQLWERTNTGCSKLNLCFQGPSMYVLITASRDNGTAAGPGWRDSPLPWKSGTVAASMKCLRT